MHPGFNLRQHFAFELTPSFSLRVVTCLEPAIQLMTSTWTVVNFKKHMTSMSYKPEPVM